MISTVSKIKVFGKIVNCKIVNQITVPTFLFDSIIVGPIKSRRLGKSLGVNLLPINCKLCNFDCIYCECGWNADGNPEKAQLRFNAAEEVHAELEKRLQELQAENNLPDAITFAGNGEPTMHPHFAQVVDEAMALRNRYAPQAKVCVLTNATLIRRPSVLSALKKVDRAMLKLDSGFDRTVKILNNPQGSFSVAQLVEGMRAFGDKLIVQTMFLRGAYNGATVDNTTPEEVEQWLKILKELKPRAVTMYTIDRETPAAGLQKISPEKMEEIAAKVRALGIIADVH
jgi:wyosine [tRNA(Phe)-imidazoG37] synthetase (radical SAM superfamily)